MYLEPTYTYGVLGYIKEQLPGGGVEMGWVLTHGHYVAISSTCIGNPSVPVCDLIHNPSVIYTHKQPVCNLYHVV